MDLLLKVGLTQVQVKAIQQQIVAGLFILGFPFAVLMGMLTFITKFIPVLGTIFAAPTAGVLQALFTALWIQYRQTHREEFLDDEQEPPAQQPEELPA